jgi:hypothetical protein
MHREMPDKYEVLLNAGTMLVEVTNGWHEITPGLRAEVIKAALRGEYAKEVRQAVRKRRPITFKDMHIKLTVRWTPVGVS